MSVTKSLSLLRGFFYYLPFNPSGTATTGYVVTKTADGYEWAAPSGGISVAPNSPITGIKYIWYGTEAQYAALSQYYTDVAGDTEFHTF